MRLRHLPSVTAFTAALLSIAPAVHAQNTALPAGPFDLGGGLWRWTSYSHFGDFQGITAGASLTLDEAVYNGRGDAYDGVHELLMTVSGSYRGYNTPAGRVDVFGDATAGFRLEAPAITFPNGLNVSESFFMFADNPITRVLYCFNNPTGSAVTAHVAWHNNLGSDSNTTIRATEDGDLVIEQTDRTFVSSDLNPSTGDPVLGWVRYGAGSPLLPTIETTPGPSNGFFRDAYDLTIAAGDTSYLLFYGLMGGDVASVSGLLQSFASNQSMAAAGLLNGLDDPTLVRIRNYNFTPGDVPEPGALGLLVGMGVGGAFFARRRLRRV